MKSGGDDCQFLELALPVPITKANLQFYAWCVSFDSMTTTKFFGGIVFYQSF